MLDLDLQDWFTYFSNLTCELQNALMIWCNIRGVIYTSRDFQLFGNNVKVFKIGFRESILLHNHQTSCALTFAAQMNLQRSLDRLALALADLISSECYNPLWRNVYQNSLYNCRWIHLRTAALPINKYWSATEKHKLQNNEDVEFFSKGFYTNFIVQASNTEMPSSHW